MGHSVFRDARLLLVSSFAVLALRSRMVDAQIGVSLCSCQPAYYEFTLDFGLTCPDQNVAGQGIVDTACVLNTQGGDNVTDFRPTIVTEIQVLELDQNLQVVFQTTYEDTFTNGDIFNYTSITRSQTGALNETSLPRGFQMFLTGRNQFEQDLVNFYAIVYDNNCGIFPLLEEGMVAGWTIFSGLGPPPQSICPVAPAQPTEAPDIVPTEAPTEAPTKAPIDPETATPTVTPSDLETSTPTLPATTPTTASPTRSPATTRPNPCPEVSIKGTAGRGRRLMVGPRTSAPTACPEPDDNQSEPEGMAEAMPRSDETHMEPPEEYNGLETLPSDMPSDFGTEMPYNARTTRPPSADTYMKRSNSKGSNDYGMYKVSLSQSASKGSNSGSASSATTKKTSTSNSRSKVAKKTSYSDSRSKVSKSGSSSSKAGGKGKGARQTRLN